MEKTGRRILIFFAVMAFILVLFGASAQGNSTAYADEDIVLYSKDENVPLVILIPLNASEPEEYASITLADYIQKITGHLPKIVQTSETPDEYGARKIEGENANYILVRITPKEGAPWGSFVLRAGVNADGTPSTDKYIFIEGCDARGVFNGVYEFLRVFCGVNVYAGDVETVPESDFITVADGYYYFYQPLLEYADTDWISPHNLEFSLANGLNGTYSPIDGAHGGNVNYITFCHSLSTSIVPAKELFKDHPEYYALTDRGREPTQLCLSNPDVINRAKEDVIELIDKNYDEDACLNIISVTQDDNQVYCKCEKCTKIADTYGGQSGLMIWFVNQIAREVALSDHPDVVVDTFAYQYTRKAPIGIRPDENVCVRLCTIECCFGHTLDDPSCEMNVDFMKDLCDWAEICDRLYIWDYTTNYAQTMGLFPDFGVIQHNIDVFVSHSVVGIYEEGAYYASDCNAEFSDLRAYLLTRYMYDPFDTYGTTEGIRDGFLKAYYGEGAGEIGQFLDYITAHAGDENGHLYIYVSMEKTLHGVTDEDVVMLDSLWKTALNKAHDAGNDEAYDRIQRSMLSWEYYKACVKKGVYAESNSTKDRIDANRALIAGLREYGITQYCEGNMMSNRLVSPFTSPDKWGGRREIIALTIEAALFLAAMIMTVVLFILFLIKKKYRQLFTPCSILVSVLLACIACAFSVSAQFAWVTAIFSILSILALASITVLSDKNTPSKKKALRFLFYVLIIGLPFGALLTVFHFVLFGCARLLASYLFAGFWHIVWILASNIYLCLKTFPRQKHKN